MLGDKIYYLWLKSKNQIWWFIINNVSNFIRVFKKDQLTNNYLKAVFNLKVFNKEYQCQKPIHLKKPLQLRNP
jgi:hypothetical protein